MDANFTDEGWKESLKRDPDSIFQRCDCGRMPAAMTNISGDTRRRCQNCYSSQFRVAMDFGEN